MKNNDKNTQMPQSLKTAVISRFNDKKVEITETELRGLIFWASVGIEKSHGGSYSKTVDFIKNRSNFMNYRKLKYRKLEFGSRL